MVPNELSFQVIYLKFQVYYMYMIRGEPRFPLYLKFQVNYKVPCVLEVLRIFWILVSVSRLKLIQQFK